MARRAAQEVECRVEEIEGGYGELEEVAKAEELEQRCQDGEKILDHRLNHRAATWRAFRTTQPQ